MLQIQEKADAKRASNKNHAKKGEGVYNRKNRQTRMPAGITNMAATHSAMVSTDPCFFLLNNLLSDERLDFFSKRPRDAEVG